MSAVPANPAPKPIPTPAERLRGRLMAQSLGQLLDRAPGARDVLPHLAALERALLERGVDAVSRVPAHWLQRICSQLSSLPLPDQDPPLHDLMQRLLRAVAQTSTGYADDADSDAERTVVIREITHSAFMAAQAEQAEQATTQAMPEL